MQSQLEPLPAAPAASPAALPTDREPVRRRRRRRLDVMPYLLISPAVIIVIGLMAYPLYRLVFLAMHRQPKGGSLALVPPAPVYVGFANFKTVLTDSQYWTVVGRTALFTVVAVGASVGLALLIALMMRRVSNWARILLTIAMVSAWSMPSIVATQVFSWMFDHDFGVINYLIDKLPGVSFQNHSWFASAIQGWTVITLLVVWGALPFLALSFYAGLTQVAPELIEAATIDGANPRQIVRRIILPVIRPILIIGTTLSVIWDFGMFNQVFVLRNSLPEPQFYTVAVYAYEKAFGQNDYDMGSAITLITTLLMVGLMVFYIRQMIKIGEVE